MYQPTQKLQVDSKWTWKQTLQSAPILELWKSWYVECELFHLGDQCINAINNYFQHELELWYVMNKCFCEFYLEKNLNLVGRQNNGNMLTFNRISKKTDALEKITDDLSQKKQ